MIEQTKFEYSPLGIKGLKTLKISQKKLNTKEKKKSDMNNKSGGKKLEAIKKKTRTAIKKIKSQKKLLVEKIKKNEKSAKTVLLKTISMTY